MIRTRYLGLPQYNSPEDTFSKEEINRTFLTIDTIFGDLQDSINNAIRDSDLAIRDLREQIIDLQVEISLLK